MAVDGTPPTKLAPSAKWLLLNDFDVLPVAQLAGGTGPFVVPARHRFIITSVAISFAQTAAPGQTRLINLAVTIENDPNPNAPPFTFTGDGTATGRSIFGMAVPNLANTGLSFEVRDLAVPVTAGGKVQLFGLTPPVGPDQIVMVQGYLEPLP